MKKNKDTVTIVKNLGIATWTPTHSTLRIASVPGQDDTSSVVYRQHMGECQHFPVHVSLPGDSMNTDAFMRQHGNKPLPVRACLCKCADDTSFVWLEIHSDQDQQPVVELKFYKPGDPRPKQEDRVQEAMEIPGMPGCEIALLRQRCTQPA